MRADSVTTLHHWRHLYGLLLYHKSGACKLVKAFASCIGVYFILRVNVHTF